MKAKREMDKQQVPHDNSLLQSKLLRMKEARRAEREALKKKQEEAKPTDAK